MTTKNSTVLSIITVLILMNAAAASGHSGQPSALQSIWGNIVGFFSGIFNAVFGGGSTAASISSSTTSSAPMYAYSVRVVSIGAVPSSTLAVGSNVSFTVTLENTGTQPIYYGGGCNQPLLFAVAPSSAITLHPTGAGTCAMLTHLIKLTPNATVTLHAPEYSVATISQAGNATVTFTFYWSKSNSTSTYQSNQALFNQTLNFVQPNSPNTTTIHLCEYQNPPSGCHWDTQSENVTTHCGATLVCSNESSLTTAAQQPSITTARVTVQQSTTTAQQSITTPQPSSSTTTAQSSFYNIDLVSVETASYSNGTSGITAVGSNILFKAEVENAGTMPVYYSSGCNPSFVYTISPSSAITLHPTGAGTCALEGLTELAPGATATLYAPEYAYATISQAGNATAAFTFYWSKSNSTSTYQSNHASLNRTFGFN